ncbi:MAG TPA: polysaccharide deacetylase family protein [Solirubrobacterales bacterium]|nr:polysaccharide deacetylase family protein [Solirubrobacterales bacterium]
MVAVTAVGGAFLGLGPQAGEARGARAPQASPAQGARGSQASPAQEVRGPQAVRAPAQQAARASGSPAPQAPRIVGATVTQAGQDLVLIVRTAKPEALARLQPRPDTRRASAAYLCFAFAPTKAGSGAGPAGDVAETRLCLGGPKARTRAGLVTVDAGEVPLTRTAVRVKVKRPSPERLVVSVVAGPTHPTGLRPGRYAWRVLAGAGGCEVRRLCAVAYPPGGATPLRLRPVRAVGCTGGDAELVSEASTGRKVLALTFDDGPSEYTERFLRVLREKHVPATFFEIGEEMPGRAAAMRKILAQGDEIGDHTMTHAELPGYGEIAGAATRIERYTGFKPCLFRPPYGAVDSRVIDTAGALGMKTITWDVDPRDWSLPGTAAIYSDVVGNVKPGAIVLMHDGGGPRDETLAALPEVIDTLRARGYSFDTVSELLGDKVLYRPYG